MQNGSILQYFRPSLSYNLIFVLPIFNGRFTAVVCDMVSASNNRSLEIISANFGTCRISIYCMTWC